MKKLMALTMVLCLVAMPFFALAEKGALDAAQEGAATEKTGFAALSRAEKLVQVRNHVRDFLDRYEVNYDYDVDFDSFDFTLEVEKSIIGQVNISIFVYDDAVASCGYLSFKYEEEHEVSMARFISLLNEEAFYGNFLMPHKQRTIYFRCVQHVESALPGDDELGVIATLPRDYVQRYGKYISEVALEGKDPLEVYEKMTKELEN